MYKEMAGMADASTSTCTYPQLNPMSSYDKIPQLEGTYCLKVDVSQGPTPQGATNKKKMATVESACDLNTSDWGKVKKFYFDDVHFGFKCFSFGFSLFPLVT